MLFEMSRDKRRIYGLLPDVCKNHSAGTAWIGCRHIFGLSMKLTASGHHGYPRVESQTEIGDPERSAALSAWLDAGPTGHAMRVNLTEHLVLETSGDGYAASA